jgi:hypothetical protein
VHLNIGTTVSVLNQDTIVHLVHYNGTTLGLAHENVSIGISQGQKYSQVVAAAGSDSLTCHYHTKEGAVFLTSP